MGELGVNAAVQGKDASGLGQAGRGRKGADQTWERGRKGQEGHPDFRLEPQRVGHYVHRGRSRYWSHPRRLHGDVATGWTSLPEPRGEMSRHVGTQPAVFSGRYT